MKNLHAFCAAICAASVLLFSACSKDKKLVEKINQQEVLNRKIQEIIPERYLDSLRKLGMTIYTEAAPPKLDGAYFISPAILLKSSHLKDPEGYRFLDAKVQFSDQKEDFSIRMLGRNFLKERDTSLVTAISGSGNNFTVYGKVKASSGTQFAIFALIISGTKSDSEIKNIRYALLNIDNSHGDDSHFLPEGFGRLIYDADGSSPSITNEVFNKISNTNPRSMLSDKFIRLAASPAP